MLTIVCCPPVALQEVQLAHIGAIGVRLTSITGEASLLALRGSILGLGSDVGT